LDLLLHLHASMAGRISHGYRWTAADPRLAAESRTPMRRGLAGWWASPEAACRLLSEDVRRVPI
jgi:hypothetical protein